MAVSSPAVAEALAEIVGGDRLVSEGAVLSRHAVDALSPRWVVWPGSAEEVSRVLALATAERLAVTPRGSGSSLPAGNPPRRLDLVLDLTRLDAIVEHVPADMVATVEAGVRLEALARRLAASGQRLTLDPIGGAGRTVGGVLATNASGPLRARHGTARDILLGVRFVQADGTITWGGSKVVKSVTGYDVPKLMVGSLGTLGIVVGATLRLQPLPPASASWLVEFREAESVEAFLAAVVASSLEPERCAVLNERARQACRLTGAGPAVAVSIASVEEAVVSQGMLLKHLADAHGGDSRSIEGAAWGTLDLALAAPVVLKLACEPRRICFWSSEIERLAGRAGWQISTVGQAGHGVLQSALSGSLSAPALERALIAPLREGLSAEAGTAVVEKAPPELKAGLDVWGPISPAALAIMARLKSEFDPLGILNPGRFVGGL